MFKKNKEKKIRVIKLSELKKSGKLSKNIKSKIKKVEHMDKKAYLKYYIKVLENQIKQATKILKEKKKELKKLR